MPTVKCADCGFLALRRSLSRDAIEVEMGTRQSGELSGDTDRRVYCFVSATLIDEECRKKEERYAHDKRKMILEVIGTDRNCDKFYAWVPGRSPKEHADIMEAQLLRESLQKREDADKAWREEQEAKRQAYEIAQKESERLWQQQQKEADAERRQEEKEADARRRQDEKNAEREWQLRQKESDRAWQIRQEWGRRVWGLVMLVAGAALGYWLGWHRR